MRNEELRVAEYAVKNRRRKNWKNVVTTLACAVTFCTVYALILPAITQERETFCGYEEHTHTEDCYAVPEHGELLCALEEAEAHTHTEDCWLPVHTHTDACYTVEPQLTCGQTEAEAHAHTDACYTVQGEPTCGQTEAEAHAHGDGCYAPVETTLVCTLAEDCEHTHTDACYATTGGELTCTLPETEGHTHTLACWPESARELTCALPETEGHAHTDACYTAGEPQLTCTLGERTEPELACTLPETEGHAHTDACYAPAPTEPQLVCELEEHTHALICYSDPNTDLETEEVWQATLPTLTGVWAEDVLAVAQSQLGYMESTKNFVVLADGQTTKGYTRYGAWYGDPYADWCAMFASFCLHYAGVEGVPLGANSAAWVQALSAQDCALYAPAADHTAHPGELIFFDSDADGTADHVGIVSALTAAEGDAAAAVSVIEGNSADRVQTVTYEQTDARILGYAALPQQEVDTDVLAVIGLIDEMPSADEIDAKIEEFEEAEDYEGEETWLTDVYQQVAKAYYYYDQLTDEQKARVTNADKLLELEYIWSVTEYSASSGTDPVDTGPIHAVNNYGTVSSSFYSILVYGGSWDEVMKDTASASMAFKAWVAIVVSTDISGNLYVVNYVNDSSDKSALKPSNTEKGFVLLAFNGSSYFDFVSKYNAGNKVYASVNFDYTKTGSAYKASGVGTISFDTKVFVKKTAEVSADPKPVQSADTSKFIELNLYDYGSNINTKFTNNKFSYTDWKGNTKYTSYYPGFQWNGGAYVKSNLWDSTSGTADRNYIDSIDFGNSLITDLKYSGANHAKSSTATDITFFADSGTYSINAMDYYYKTINGTQNLYVYGVNNRPIGLSIGSSITDTTYDVLKRTLGTDGYPELNANDASLQYLFSQNTYATKQNTTKTITGLFQYEEKTGGYWYDSRWNHAQYDSNTQTFILYDEIITPNFITYPFGNFLPFNDITDSETSTQVSEITSMGNYMDYMLDQLYPYTKSDYTAGFDASRNQLYYMLNQYKSNVKYYGINGKTWSNFNANDAIWDYLTGGGEDEGDSPITDAQYPITNDYLKTLYNIDYDVEKNFFFGMEMKMEFYMPKDGMVGMDNGTNSSKYDSTTHEYENKTPDGIPDHPMIFSFTGDDDVWVYVDDVLFLDLSGIHRHVGGRINYTEGWVEYYALNNSTGDIDTSTPYARYTFNQILKAAGKTPAEIEAILKYEADKYDLDKDGNTTEEVYTTFQDYSTHSFNFYYMERGSGSSVCSINFNFPLVDHNSITVSKELTADNTSVEALGNPDFSFQVIDADGSDAGSNFLGEGWAYTLVDTNGATIQEIKVSETYQDGRVKAMTITDGAGNLLCTEYYNSDGKLASRDGTDENLAKIRRIDENGVFTLKAGQTATFVGLPNTVGDNEYYVRELLNGLETQYGKITISGSATRIYEDNALHTETFVGADSSTQFTSNSHVFHYDNQITVDKLGSLEITKVLRTADTQKAAKQFAFRVELDGTQIPVGTPYTVWDSGGKKVADKTVAEGETGVVWIEPGQTARIENILAGSSFKVWEDSTSADGYKVDFEVSNADNLTEATGSTGNRYVTGNIKVDTTVSVTGINIEGISVPIPGTKSVTYAAADDTTKRSYFFKLEQVADENGTAITEGTAYTETDEVVVTGNTPANFQFDLAYTSTQFPTSSSAPVKYYYKITESADQTGYTVIDPTVYIAEVTITLNDAGEVSAALTNMWKKNGTSLEAVSGKNAAFVNTLTGDLKVTKFVEGSSSNYDKSFNFVLTLASDNDSVAIPAKIKDDKGTDYTVSESGEVAFTLKHNESVTFVDLPHGLTWTVTEKSAEGYLTSNTVGGQTSDDAAVATGVVAASSAATLVVYTNTQLYALPKTGGAGTTAYTMAGLMLICGAAYLLYKTNKRRREVL